MAHVVQKYKTHIFRFQSFSERMRSFDVRERALYNIGNEFQELEENGSLFCQTLKKLTVLNVTPEFIEFSNRCTKIVTLTQLIHQKQCVLNELLNSISVSTIFSLQPLLELLMAICQDLRTEFCPYFQRSLETLIPLLNTKDANQLEATFCCIAFIFKSLKHFLKNDITLAFKAVFPLLDESLFIQEVGNFAAECFAFIARDVQERKEVLKIMLEAVTIENHKIVRRCGKILSEIVRGVKGNFHNVADEYIEFLFQSFDDKNLLDSENRSSAMLKIVSSAVSEILDFVNPQNMEIFWHALYRVTLNSCSDMIYFTIHIILQIAENKNGLYLTESDVILRMILNILDRCNLKDDDRSTHTIHDLVSTVLLSSHVKISHLNASCLIKKIFKIHSVKCLDKFLVQISSHPQFELIVLPDLVKYCEKNFDAESLELLASIILKKSPLAKNAEGLSIWKPYPILLTESDTYKKIETIINRFELESNDDSIEEFLLTLIIAPHIKGVEKKFFSEKLFILCEQLTKKLDNEKYLFITAIVIEVIICLGFSPPDMVMQNLVSAIEPLCFNQKNSISAIRIINQIYSQKKQLFKNAGVVSLLLDSCIHEIRLTSASCLWIANSAVRYNPYNIFYEAEKVCPSLHNYREILLNLQKLAPNGEYSQFLSDQYNRLHVLRFLLGFLHNNFELLWEPVLNLVREYSKLITVEEFWSIYYAKLSDISKKIEDRVLNEIRETVFVKNVWKSNVLSENQIPENTALTLQELINYRCLLWKELQFFGKIVQIKNRDLVELFLNFMQREYRKSFETENDTVNLTQNFVEILKQCGSVKNCNENIGRIPLKFVIKTLKTMLMIFQSLENPKQIYREPEMYSIYLKLLSNRIPLIQKAALDCIMAYKMKSLSLCSEQLYTLTDENKFKQGLINFDHSMLLPDFRNDVMKILLQIIYGKFFTTNKNIDSCNRKKIIIRFLAQCGSHEVKLFLEMVFKNFKTFTDDPIQMENIPEMVSKHFSPQAVSSPKILLAIIRILELIRKEIGCRAPIDLQSYMLKFIVYVAVVCNAVIEIAHLNNYGVANPDKICTIYRNVKNTALHCLVNFFAQYQDFVWTSSQMITLTNVFISGSIQNLPMDSIHSPTPLLKLILQWGDNPKLSEYIFQTLCNDKHTIFQYLIDLLLNDKTKSSVRKPIFTLIERLMKISSYENSSGVHAYGFIQPYIPQILVLINKTMCSKSTLRKVRYQEINVLLTFSDQLKDANMCESFLQIILKYLSSKLRYNVPNELMISILKTISKLLLRIDTSKLYICKIAPLFEYINDVSGRKTLCQLLFDIAKKNEKCNAEELSNGTNTTLTEVASIISALNSWNSVWIDQPDYEVRLATFKTINSKLIAGCIDINFGILIIYNCFYFIRYNNDVGLRENAIELLKTIIPTLAFSVSTDKNSVDYLVGDIIFNWLRVAITDENDNIRIEGIRLLGEMVRKCSFSHQILQDMLPLTDVDVELDFFENITHLQTHRHCKALLKFCSLAETFSKSPSHKMLIHFILPMISHYLLNDRYRDKHTLINAAIDAIGTVCQFLPWQNYEQILKHYILKLRGYHNYQKQCVRIVVHILDAFHFSSASIDTKTAYTSSEKCAEILNKMVDRDVTQQKFQNEQDMENFKNKITNGLNTTAIVQKREMVELSNNAMQKIISIYIPILSQSLTQQSSYDSQHKLIRKKRNTDRECEEILRVPISLALVKLMQKLPKNLLDTNLPGVLMKTCTFLKSPLKSVRIVTRDILKKIIVSLGSDYLSMLVFHLSSLLKQGFQVHVLSVTLYGVLDALQNSLKPGDIESCLTNILEVSLSDIFGEVAAAKEIGKIISSVPEAKPSTKSYLIMGIIARNIQESHLLNLLLPFKKYLAFNYSPALKMKIQDCFTKIANGITVNSHISPETLLIFVHGVISESIPELCTFVKQLKLRNDDTKLAQVRQDCFLISPAPISNNFTNSKTVRSNLQINAHMLNAFGFELFYTLLRTKKIKNINYESYIKPILPLITSALATKHLRVLIFASKCLSIIWNDSYDLPTMQDYLDIIVIRLFEILEKFSSYAAIKIEENYRLMKSVFKAIIALLRNCSYYNLKTSQINQLLFYVEHEIYNNSNQTIAFTLLRTLVALKVENPQMHQIMKKICEISITSQSSFHREEARTILINYVMEYSLKKRFDIFLKFYIKQLTFLLPSGRISAIKFLSIIIKKLPSNILSKKCKLIFVALGPIFVNDNHADCRREVAECVELLITRTRIEDRQLLFDVTLNFLQDQKSSTREMGAVLCSRFVTIEKQSFDIRISTVFPVLVGCLSKINPQAGGIFVRNLDYFENDEKSLANIQHSSDHEVVQLQNCLLKVFEVCAEILIQEEFDAYIDVLAYHSQKLFAHEHDWVRINAIKIINEILKKYDFNVVRSILENKNVKSNSKKTFIYANPVKDIQALVLDLSAQMMPGRTSKFVIDEVVKVFFMIGIMLDNILVSEKKANHKSEGRKINFEWLIYNIRIIINKERVQSPNNHVMREALLTLIDDFVSQLNNETIKLYSQPLLSVVVREISEDDKNTNSNLRYIAIRVGKKLRHRLGANVYDNLQNSIQTNLQLCRINRKKLFNQSKINNPLRAAKRKVQAKERKKFLKKRKIGK